MGQPIRILVAAVCFLFAATSYSQDRCDAVKWEKVKKLYTMEVQRYGKDIEQFKHESMLALTITLAVGILGAVAALLQQIQSSWRKTATMIAGGGVTILTVINNNAFDGDHRALDKKAIKIEHLATLINEKLEEDFNFENCEDFKKQRNEIRKLLDEMHGIRVGDEQRTVRFDSPFLPEVAYAQETKKDNLPSWVISPPQEKDKINFVGIGHGQSLRDAEDSAVSDGQEQVRDFFAQEFGRNRRADSTAADSKTVADFLANYAQTVNKHFAYDPKEKDYTYYALIRVDRELAEDYVKLYAAQEGLVDTQPYSDVLQKTPGLSNEYFARRRVTYGKLADHAKKEIPKEIYADFEHGRQLRKTGQAAEAAKILTAVTQKQPDFYLAWYNLALAFMAMGADNQADAAFKKAAAYEQSQALRDASIYNSYGWFLYLNKRYDEAVKAFEQALLIDPDHPKARSNLAAAKKASSE